MENAEMKTFRIAIQISFVALIVGQVMAQQPATGAAPSASPVAIVSGNVVSVSTNIGQDAALLFTGSATQRMSLLLDNSTYPASCHLCDVVTATILKPDGGILASSGLSDGASRRFVDSRMLPLNGTYKIVFHSQGQSSGSVNVILFLFSDKKGSVTNGSVQTVGTSTPGQDVRLTFDGTANQEASVALSDSTFGSCTGCSSLSVRLMGPAGTPVGWTRMSEADTSANLSSVRLPSTGKYTLVIDPQGDRTGNVDVVVSVQ
jgi:large repetitive protein